MILQFGQGLSGTGCLCFPWCHLGWFSGTGGSTSEMASLTWPATWWLAIGWELSGAVSLGLGFSSTWLAWALHSQRFVLWGTRLLTWWSSSPRKQKQKLPSFLKVWTQNLQGVTSVYCDRLLTGLPAFSPIPCCLPTPCHSDHTKKQIRGCYCPA